MRAFARRDLGHAVGEGGGSEILVEVAALEDLFLAFEPLHGGRSGGVLGLAGSVVGRKGGDRGLHVARSRQDEQLAVQVSPKVWITAALPAALILSLLAMNSAHDFGTDRPSSL